MGKYIDLTGQRFGKLTVIEYAGRNEHGHTQWLCRCDCGNKTIACGFEMKRGNTKSCGCLTKGKRTKLEGCNNKPANMRGSRLYKVWSNVKLRCFNVNNPKYKNYGGRGITMCDEWRYDYKAFYKWAIENGYDENAPFGKCTLDRKDNNGNYEPSNCRWITNKEQQNNRRNNHLVTYKGETHTIAEWREILNMSHYKISQLIKKGYSEGKGLKSL